MGEVRKPESLIRRRPSIETPDMPHIPSSSQPVPTSLENLIREIQEIKNEVSKVKQALKAHGIVVE
jgi:hypothetical protein